MHRERELPRLDHLQFVGVSEVFNGPVAATRPGDHRQPRSEHLIYPFWSADDEEEEGVDAVAVNLAIGQGGQQTPPIPTRAAALHARLKMGHAPTCGRGSCPEGSRGAPPLLAPASTSLTGVPWLTFAGTATVEQWVALR
eukprot:1703417-Pyramimonas_sp.AAC.1